MAQAGADRGVAEGHAGQAAGAPARPAGLSRLLPAVVVGVVVLAGIGAALRGPLERRPVIRPTTTRSVGADAQTLEETTPTTSPSPSLAGESIAIEVPPWVSTALWTLLALATALLVGMILRRLLELRSRPDLVRRPPVVAGQTAAATEAPDLAEPIAQAWQGLRASAPPRDAVVAAWVALEDGAAAHGAGRAASETPTEFTEYVLRETSADPEAIAALRASYLRARFGPDPVTPQDVDRAAAALARIEATWSG